MFSIFTYIMSRVTHSEPGLPMFLRRKTKSSYEGPYHVVRKKVLVFSLTEAGEQQIGWVLGMYQATMGAVGKACHICQTSMPKSTVQLSYILDTILPR